MEDKEGRRRQIESVETAHCLIGVVEDLEDLIEFRDLEDFTDLRIDLGQSQLALLAFHPVVDRDQRTESGRGQVLDIAESNHDHRSRYFIHDGGELLADLLNV